MDKTKIKAKTGPGPDLAEVDLSKVDIQQVRKWLKNDVQRCISMFVAIADNESVLDELAEAFFSRMKQQLAEVAKAKEAPGK